GGGLPISKPETQTVRDFFAAHPNIDTVFDTHSGAYMIITPWTYIGTPTPDNGTYNALIQRYQNLTVYIQYNNGAQGTATDWMYETQSAMCFTLELFGAVKYPDGAAQLSLDYPDSGVSWQNYTHPELGDVQIGGAWLFRMYNPPDAEIGKWAQKVIPMLLDLAWITPKIKLVKSK